MDERKRILQRYMIEDIENPTKVSAYLQSLLREKQEVQVPYAYFRVQDRVGRLIEYSEVIGVTKHLAIYHLLEELKDYVEWTQSLTGEEFASFQNFISEFKDIAMEESSQISLVSQSVEINNYLSARQAFDYKIGWGLKKLEINYE